MRFRPDDRRQVRERKERATVVGAALPRCIAAHVDASDAAASEAVRALARDVDELVLATAHAAGVPTARLLAWDHVDVVDEAGDKAVRFAFDAVLDLLTVPARPQQPGWRYFATPTRRTCVSIAGDGFVVVEWTRPAAAPAPIDSLRVLLLDKPRCAPGGTHLAADTVGYRWSENFLCALFSPQALNGADNAARSLAIGALLLLCVCLGVVFFLISRSTTSRLHRSAIEIGGIGTAVYSMFVVTPMHDLVVSIGFVFGLVALVAVGHLMWRERRRGLLLWGVAVLVLKVASAVSYYGNVAYDWLPVLQKVGIVVGLSWVLAVYYRCGVGNTRG